MLPVNQTLINCFTAFTLIVNSRRGTLAPEEVWNGNTSTMYLQGILMAYSLDNFNYAHYMLSKPWHQAYSHTQYYEYLNTTQSKCLSVANEASEHIAALAHQPEVRSRIDEYFTKLNALDTDFQDNSAESGPQSTPVSDPQCSAVDEESQCDSKNLTPSTEKHVCVNWLGIAADKWLEWSSIPK